MLNENLLRVTLKKPMTVPGSDNAFYVANASRLLLPAPSDASGNIARCTGWVIRRAASQWL